jgi:pilus assembly protein CpaB
MLNRRSLFFLALAVVFGIGAAYTARDYLASQAAHAVPGKVAVTPVVVAKKALSVGAPLSSLYLGTQDWPTAHRPSGTFTSVAQLEGRVLRRALAPDEPIFDSALLPEGSEAGLSALIAENHRAVSVKVDAVVGVAGFVKPGARVDVLATLRRRDAPNFSNVILQDVRVLAVDQTMEKVRDGEPKVVNVATLEVNTEEAERLIHAAHEGKLQLALRHPTDEKILKTSAIRASDLMGRPAAKKASAPRPSITVIKGTSVSHQDL